MLMQSEVAGMGRRLVALVVDLMMLMLASIPLQLGLREVTPSAVVLWVLLYLIMLCYATIFLGGRGQTPGKVMASLRVIGAEGGGVNQRQAFVRSVVKWTPIFGFWIFYLALAPFSTGPEPVALEVASVEAVEAVEAMLEQALVSMAVLLLGLIVGLFLTVSAKRHPDGQAVHDRVADTYVIRLP